MRGVAITREGEGTEVIRPSDLSSVWGTFRQGLRIHGPSTSREKTSDTTEKNRTVTLKIDRLIKKTK